MPHGMTVNLTEGNDRILGLAVINEDSIDFGGGDDIFEMETYSRFSGKSHDLSEVQVSKLDGGEGSDTLIFARGHGLQEITLNSINAVNFENLRGSSVEDDIMHGDDKDNEIDGA